MTMLTVPSARSAEIQLQTLWPHSNKPSTMTGRKSPRETCTWGCLEGELIWMRELSVARDMLLVFTGTCLTTHSEASTSSSPKSQTHFGHWNFGDSSSMAGTLTTGNNFSLIGYFGTQKTLTHWLCTFWHCPLNLWVPSTYMNQLLPFSSPNLSMRILAIFH